jgi:predicted anti-sigma-YlaC factor YlaD
MMPWRGPDLRPRRVQKAYALSIFPALALGLSLHGCSVKQLAMNGLDDALSAGGSSVYLNDDDPVLVGEALPFGLKLMETVLEDTPDHEDLLVAAASGFVMYGQAWVLRPSRVMEANDLGVARRERERAKALFLRAREYARRALEIRHPNLLDELGTNPEASLVELAPRDLPAMYWYAAATASAIISDLSDMELVAEFSVVPAFLERGLALDETWNRGALHELLMAMPASAGGTAERAEHHFERAMELNGGLSLGPLVSLAEGVCVPQQDRARFTTLLTEVLAFDVDVHPENRLANILAQEHAIWLLSRTEELFLTTPETTSNLTKQIKDEVRWPVRF